MSQPVPFAGMTPLDDDQLAELRANYPGLPQDYLSFLRDVGYGEIGANAMMIYSGPIEPSAIFGQAERALDQLYLLFGDRAGGVMAAFELNLWGIVEIEHEGLEIEPVAESFTAFIDRLVSDDA